MILLPPGKRQLQQAAGALAVDVDHVVLQPAVDMGLDRRQHGGGEAVVLASLSGVAAGQWSSSLESRRCIQARQPVYRV
jgi:hypothetical protein